MQLGGLIGRLEVCVEFSNDEELEELLVECEKMMIFEMELEQEEDAYHPDDEELVLVPKDAKIYCARTGRLLDN